jgi:hypothetical protein
MMPTAATVPEKAIEADRGNNHHDHKVIAAPQPAGKNQKTESQKIGAAKLSVSSEPSNIDFNESLNSV